MAVALRVFDVAGSGGVNLNDATNFRFVGVDWGGADLLRQTYSESAFQDGGKQVNKRSGIRTVTIRVQMQGSITTKLTNWQTIGELMRNIPANSEIGYKADSAASTWSYLDIIGAGGVDWVDEANNILEVVIHTWPYWRTVALTSPRHLENLSKNAYLSRWTAGAPDNWTQNGTPTTFAQSTTSPLYGLNTLHVVCDAASEGAYQTITGLTANTTYAVYAKVNQISGTIRLSCHGPAGGDPVMYDDSADTGNVMHSFLYTTATGQTSIILYVVSVTSSAAFRLQVVFLGQASNTGGAVPTEFVGYTGDLYNHEDTQADHVNGVYVADLLGNAPAPAAARFTSTTLAAAADRIHLALRDAYPQYHVFQYQAEVGTQNGSWPAALFDGGPGASPESTVGSVVQLTAPGSPGTKDWAYACRVTLSPLSGEGASIWLYRRGRFRVLARVATDATTASNWELKGALRIQSNLTRFNAPVALSMNGSVYHLVDLGEFSIPSGQPGDDMLMNPLYLEIQAKVATEPSKLLNIDCLYLVPNDCVAQTIFANNATTWSANGRVFTSTLEEHVSKAYIDDGTNYLTDAVPGGHPLLLPVAVPKTTDSAYRTHFIINWLLQRDAGGHALTDRCRLRLSYIPQYLAPAAAETTVTITNPMAGGAIAAKVQLHTHSNNSGYVDFPADLMAFYRDAGYIYAGGGGGTTDTIRKYLKPTMALADESASYGGTISCMAEDDDNIYIAGNVTRTVRKYDKATLTLQAESANYGGVPIALAVFGAFVLVGGDTTQTVRKLNVSDLSLAAESANYGGVIRAIQTDGTNVYVAGATTNVIRKLLFSDLSFVADSASLGGTIYALEIETGYVYAGGGSPNAVRKYDKATLTLQATSANYGGVVFALAQDTTYVYVGGATTQTVRKLAKSDLVQIAESANYGGVIYALSCITLDGGVIYVGGDTTEKVYTLLKSDLSKVKEAASYGSTIWALVDDNSRGYDAVAISDYEAGEGGYYTPDPNVAGILFLGGAEEMVGWQSKVPHLGTAGVSQEWTTETIDDDPQALVDAVHGVATGWIKINHPTYTTLTNAQVASLVGMGYDALEIYNAITGNDESAYLDAYLSLGLGPLYVVGVDDSHDYIAGSQGDRVWTIVHVASLSVANIITAMKSGNMYASQGPTLAVSVSGGVITVTADESGVFTWYKTGGAIVKSETGTTSNYTPIGGEEYLRVKFVRTSDSKIAWSQALTVTVS